MKYVLLGATIGAFFGYCYPTLLGKGQAGAEGIFAFEYGMAGGVLTFAVRNYLRMRKRLMDRARAPRED